MRRLISPILAGVAMLLVRPALATPNFPNAVQVDLGLTYSPPCSLCHAGGSTTSQTVTTPFAVSMKARGMVASDDTALQAALDRMAADHVDSDNDGVSDIDELKAGSDPNVPAGEEAMTYGCSTAPVGTAGPGSPLVLLGALFALERARRRVRGRHAARTG
jgi:MYXO-CTERM domain-containing protein